MDVVQSHFRPEFLNRLDEILLFKRLGRAHMRGIVDIQMRELEGLLSDRRIVLSLDDEAKSWIAEAGYNPAYGARPLKRTIQTEIQNVMAEMILRGEILDGAKVNVGVKDDALVFNVENDEGHKGSKSKRSVA